jgi:hypothetical protein
MSETPRNDDEQFRDPTASSFDAPPQDPGVQDAPGQDGPPTEQVPTGSTQQLPSPPGGDVPPPPPPNPYAASPAPGATPPPPENPYAAPPAPGAGGGPVENPWASQPYPSQGEVQTGQSSGYGPPPPGYGQAGGYGAAPAPGGYAAPRQMSGNTIALLVVAGLTTLGCGFGIVALVFAIIAATKSDQPAEQAKFTRWGWIAEAVGLAFVVIAVVLVIVFGIVLSNTSSSGY